ncbi:hypothetical protein MKX03_025630 [Papaver bracteatum]|nr:hypothetical protein MKX03_025630 [Papaver bracteatum]
MEITRRKSHAFFANPQMFAMIVMIVCLSICAETASAWSNICIPGDVYIGSSKSQPRRPNCRDCTNWCSGQCSSFRTSMSDHRCSIMGNVLRCKCCCRIPTPSPSTPPSPPFAPSPPSNPDDYTGPAVYTQNVCRAGELFLMIRRGNGNDCVNKPVCAGKCKEKGRVTVREECAGNTYGNVFNWFNKCCCASSPPPSPPPPPPSPPPPSPPPPPPSPPPPSPPPPPPSPPPPSPPPPPPSPPPPYPPPPRTRTCDYITTPIMDCDLCTFDYCTSVCSARGVPVVRTSCAPPFQPCRCCCSTVASLPSSTADLLSEDM